MSFELTSGLIFPRYRKALEKIVDRFCDRQYEELLVANRAVAVPRVYLAHIPKTAGRSLTFSFLEMGCDAPQAVYARLAQHGGHRAVSGGRVLVGWDKRHIQKGLFDYAFSHTPLHQLSLPAGTFVVTCLRDPVQRVLSYYRMLKNYYDSNTKHPVLRRSARWFAPKFSEFLDRIPKKDLHAQLYMFSRRYDVEEAMTRIGMVSHVIHTEEFKEGLSDLGQKLALPLKTFHVFPTSAASFTLDEISRLREMMEPEYRFMERVRSSRGKRIVSDAALSL